jgi:SanA protein
MVTKHFLRSSIRFFTLVLCLCILVLGLFRLITWLYSWPRTYTLENVPLRRLAIVFGAGLRRDGTPTPILRDRVDTAVKLFQQGKVEKLLLSGSSDNLNYYNEPASMRSYAIQQGVPPEAIILDYAGQSTYDTCYRARDIFQVKDVVLVTQGFHLPRAVYTCNALGLRAIGVSADRQYYRIISRFFWNLREMPATVNALWEIYISQPTPILGKPEPVFPYEAR